MTQKRDKTYNSERLKVFPYNFTLVLTMIDGYIGYDSVLFEIDLKFIDIFVFNSYLKYILQK